MQLHKSKQLQGPVDGFQKELRRLQFILVSVLCFVLVLGLGASVHVYRLIYTSLSQVQEIVAQRSALSAAVIEFDRFETVEKRWQEKYTTSTIMVERDPFGAGVGPATTSTTLPVVVER